MSSRAYLSIVSDFNAMDVWKDRQERMFDGGNQMHTQAVGTEDYSLFGEMKRLPNECQTNWVFAFDDGMLMIFRRKTD